MSIERDEKPGSFVTLSDGLSMHYQLAGQGENTLLFVPGWTMTTDVFHRQLDYFKTSEEFRFITFDPRSHGQTTQSTEGNHYEQHGRDLKYFIDALKLDNLVLCGWSFGTLATLSYVSQFGTDKLRGFIMLDGPPRAAADNTKRNWATYSYDDADGSEEFFTMGKLRDAEHTNVEFARWMLENKTQRAIDWIVAMTDKTPNEVAALLNATARYLNYEKDLIDLSANLPVWCVVREECESTVVRWCNENLTNARVSAFGEHMMFWEQADRFNLELLEFVGNISVPG